MRRRAGWPRERQAGGQRRFTPAMERREAAAAAETLADLVIVLSSGFLAMYFPQVPSRAAGGSPPRLCSMRADGQGQAQGQDGAVGTGSNGVYGT